MALSGGKTYSTLDAVRWDYCVRCWWPSFVFVVVVVCVALLCFFLFCQKAAAVGRSEHDTGVTVCPGSMCTVGPSFEDFNSGTGSSFIYHPDGCVEHARGCSEIKVCEKGLSQYS